jgi:para-nitrobenzyl esterase
LASHEGAQMARNHDVVQVSVNHHLNDLGFLDLSEVGGEAYADSVNVGMTDLVASLLWVRENIANFGGDPDEVMIYGQSGGGSKVTCLMGMASAAGLFHRASAQSGGGNPPSGEQSRALTKQLLADVGLGPRDTGALQRWSGPNSTRRSRPPPKSILPRRELSGWARRRGPTPRVGTGPTVDGRVITVRFFY